MVILDWYNIFLVDLNVENHRKISGKKSVFFQKCSQNEYFFTHFKKMLKNTDFFRNFLEFLKEIIAICLVTQTKLTRMLCVYVISI